MSDALPINTSWWHLIETRAQLTPERVFLNDEQGRSLTYAGYRDLDEAGGDLFGEMAAEAIDSRDCRIVTSTDWEADTELSLPRADPAGLPPRLPTSV